MSENVNVKKLKNAECIIGIQQPENNCSFQLIFTKVRFLSVNIFIANIAAERQREIGCDQTQQKNNQH